MACVHACLCRGEFSSRPWRVKAVGIDQPALPAVTSSVGAHAIDSSDVATSKSALNLSKHHLDTMVFVCVKLLYLPIVDR